MNSTNYEAALSRAVWRPASHFGHFLCTGSDAGTLLHHLTTNDIKGLRPGSACDAALVTNKGRVLDLLTIARTAEGAFVVITSPNRRELFEPHARKFILFRQEVAIADATATREMVALWGPGADAIVAGLGEGVVTAPTQRLPGGGYFVWSDTPSALTSQLEQTGCPRIDDATYNVLRVEAGVPVAGLELTDAINPWEARLDDAISLHKGCYNGQEIVARLNTYQKVKQRLYGLRLGDNLNAPPSIALKAAGRDAGTLTSAVQSPRFGPIALAYVRTDYQTAGAELVVLNGEREVAATVCELPFADAEAHGS